MTRQGLSLVLDKSENGKVAKTTWPTDRLSMPLLLRDVASL
jgi:hypothetical protein